METVTLSTRGTEKSYLKLIDYRQKQFKNCQGETRETWQWDKSDMRNNSYMYNKNKDVDRLAKSML